MEINSLPLETFIDILRRTDGPTLGTCRRVCAKWKDIIDGTDILWHEFCKEDFRYSSKLAKRKSGNDCNWYHIYKNLYMWCYITSFERNIREFYKFSLHDKTHALEVDYGILPLKDARGVVLYDLNTLKYIPVVIHENQTVKMANNDDVTIIHIKNYLFVQRTVQSHTYIKEDLFKCDNFILHRDLLFFYTNRDVFKCDLTLEALKPKFIVRCTCDIKELQYDNRKLYIFTDCGNIVTIDSQLEVTEAPLNCPQEWIRQIKYVRAFDDKNFICYSRNLFKIETNHYKHLYLDFPPITALFFYADVVLIGTRSGEILLYRLDSQKFKIKPIFENIAILPDGKFPVQLDVCEKRTGPVIIAATFFEIYLLEFYFFPHVSIDITLLYIWCYLHYHVISHQLLNWAVKNQHEMKLKLTLLLGVWC